jgi:hypothetical protein
MSTTQGGFQKAEKTNEERPHPMRAGCSRRRRNRHLVRAQRLSTAHIPVRTEQPGGAGSGFEARLQPNPVCAEPQPTGPARPGKSAPSKKRTTASRAPARLAAEPAASNPGGYPWPPPPQ